MNPSRTTSTNTLRKSRSILKHIVDNKLVATTASSRIVRSKRQREGMTLSSHEEETVCEDQEHERTKGRGRGRQRLMHVDGESPLCMR